MALIIIFFLTLLFYLILDVKLWDIIEAPNNKSLFWFCAILAIVLFIISAMPGLIVERPNGLYRGNFKSHLLLSNYKQTKTTVSVIAFGGLIILSLFSPIWYRKSDEVSKKDLLVFCLTALVIGSLLLISFFPEIAIGQRPWKDPNRSGGTIAEIDKWVEKKRFLSDIWIFTAMIVIPCTNIFRENIFKVFHK